MKVLNKDLSIILFWLDQVSELKGVKFAYAVAKNKSKINSYLEKSKKKFIKDTKEYIEFDKERLELAKNHAKKDKKGNVKTKIDQQTQRQVYDIKDEKKFNKDFGELKKKYKKALDERDSQVEKYNKFLEKKTDFEFHKIDRSDVPEDINANQLDGIKEILND